MRGSVFFQTSILIKSVFTAGLKKENRIDSSHQHYQNIASYNSADTYRKVWNDFGHYVRRLYDIKDFEQITDQHIAEYMYQKLSEGTSHQHLQKISSALGKLEIALTRISQRFSHQKEYDFSIRFKMVKQAKKEELTSNDYRDRAYAYPEHIIALLHEHKFKVAASIQLSGGARAEGVCLITADQLLGIDLDSVSQQMVGSISTKEKGGKQGEVLVGLLTYQMLKEIIDDEGIFKVDYRRYTQAIGEACRIIGCQTEGSHGFRWNFAQRRVVEFQDSGYTYEESLQMVSYEMKHQRADITSHYIG